MHLQTIRTLILATMVTSLAAYSQNRDVPFQVNYAANLGVGDSVINITNSGATGAGLASASGITPMDKTAAVTGAICVNVYAFTQDEQMVSCCSCPVTPNGLVSLSAKQDLASNTLTPTVPNTLVIKLLATVPRNNTCVNSAAAVADGVTQQANGMLAWGTTIHATPAGAYGVTESAFQAATLSAAGTGANIGELNRLGQLCNFIIANGSGWGICKTCRQIGLGGVRQ